jgi:hypothetical protein
MPRLTTRLTIALLFCTTFALAQPFKVDPDAAPAVSASASASAPASASAAAPPPPAWPRAPEPSATTTSSAPRPDPGPGLRERGGRRRGNPASGMLFAILIVGSLGYWAFKYVKKKMR